MAKLDAKRVELAMAGTLAAILVGEQLSKLLLRWRQRSHAAPAAAAAVAAAHEGLAADCTVCVAGADGCQDADCSSSCCDPAPADSRDSSSDELQQLLLPTHDSIASSSPVASRRWQRARAWMIDLAIGSVAGTLSGVMEGLTGVRHAA